MRYRHDPQLSLHKYIKVTGSSIIRSDTDPVDGASPVRLAAASGSSKLFQVDGMFCQEIGAYRKAVNFLALDVFSNINSKSRNPSNVTILQTLTICL